MCSPCASACGPECPAVVLSAGAYAPPCGYSSNEPAPPKATLPAFNNSCVLSPPVPRPWSKWIVHEEVVVNKEVSQSFSTCKTFVIENNVHHQHNKTVITTVNRNHLHTQRIITKENNFHHFNTDYVVKVNDLHTQRVENLAADGVTINDYRQSSKVEGATCQVTVDAPCASPCDPCGARAPSPAQDPCAVAVPAPCGC